MKKFLLLLPLLVCFLFPGYTQMTGGQIFLQGVFSEVGISQCGVYGASSPPAGYNGNVFGALGFVADQEMDGWSTSSPGQPVRCGDYFYPGSPYEAWGIEINGVAYANYNVSSTCDGAIGGGIPGSATFYSNAGSTTDGQWEGDIIDTATDINLHVCQYTVVPDSELFFSTTITLKNNGTTPLNNVYYIRHLDPDNEQPTSSVFNTDNTVVQNPSGAMTNALCTATGQNYGCFLGMLSTGYPDARAFIGGTVGTFPLPISDTWSAGPGFNTTVGSTNGGADDCMGLTNFWNSIAPGQSVTFKFYYVLDPGAINNAINASQSIDVYVNGNLASIESGGSTGTGSCATATFTDTLRLRSLYCIDDLVKVDINSTVPYMWTWPLSPNISVLDPTGDSVTVITTGLPDSTTYQVNGLYNVGTDTSHVILLLTLVEEKPVAYFTYDLGCLTIPTCFFDSSTTTPGSSIVFYEWNFPEAGLISFAEDTCVLLSTQVLHHAELTVTTANGCRDTYIDSLIPNDVPLQFPTEEILFCNGEQVVLSNDSSIGTSYLWNTGDSTFAITVSSAGTYILTVSNYCGAIKDTFEVVVLPNLANLTLPNVFTPNGDGVNDEYIVNDLSMTDDYQMDFFDRWGILIYSTKDMYASPWKGKAGENGTLVPEGTYYIVLRAINCDGVEVNKTQFISIFY